MAIMQREKKSPHEAGKRLARIRARGVISAESSRCSIYEVVRDDKTEFSCARQRISGNRRVYATVRNGDRCRTDCSRLRTCRCESHIVVTSESGNRLQQLQRAQWSP